MHVSSAQRRDPRRLLNDRLQTHALDARNIAPVVLVRFDYQVFVRAPAHELVRPGPNRLTCDNFRSARGPLRCDNRGMEAGQPRQQGRIRRAGDDVDGVLIDNFDILNNRVGTTRIARSLIAQRPQDAVSNSFGIERLTIVERHTLAQLELHRQIVNPLPLGRTHRRDRQQIPLEHDERLIHMPELILGNCGNVALWIQAMPGKLTRAPGHDQLFRLGPRWLAGRRVVKGAHVHSANTFRAGGRCVFLVVFLVLRLFFFLFVIVVIRYRRRIRSRGWWLRCYRFVIIIVVATTGGQERRRKQRRGPTEENTPADAQIKQFVPNIDSVFRHAWFLLLPPKPSRCQLR